MSVATPVIEAIERRQDEAELPNDPRASNVDARAWVKTYSSQIHEPVELASKLLGVPLS